MTHFQIPVRAIQNTNDLDTFKKSESFKEVSAFVMVCADSVVGKKISDTYPISAVIVKVLLFLDRLYNLVGEVPPLKQPMRFGNKAFKEFHTLLCKESVIFLRDLLPEESVALGAADEIACYINGAFGNETRIDYGTGHEFSFSLFLYCLFKMKLIGKEDLPAAVLQAFVGYIRVMRRLQEDYLLEPAGSHGVWGLDDYHCLIFLWGSAQLVGHEDITPNSIHDNAVLVDGAKEYMYLEGIQFIKKIKKGGPFSETSPMLNDISGMADWTKVCSGLMRLFEGEVLCKFPVVQHVLFGSLLIWSSVPEGDKKNALDNSETQINKSLLSVSASTLDGDDDGDDN
jgi:hypothetical protein